MYTMVYTSFSAWLQEKMNERGISQAELARQAVVTRAAINNILRDNRGPGVDLCKGLAVALKLPPEEVYRAAGLLAPQAQGDPILDQIEALYNTLTEEGSRIKALEFLRFLSDLEDKHGRSKTTHSGK